MPPSPSAAPVPCVNYASFWQRFAAGFLDFILLLPVLLALQWVAGLSRGFAVALEIPIAAVYFAYTVYLHGRFGCTAGKYLMKIRVVRVDGTRIGPPEAMKRSAVDAGFAVLHVAGSLLALSQVSEAEFAAGARGLGVNMAVEAHEPRWMAWALIANQIWIWSEVIVMLFNQQRRALHDFIAGTIVVSLK